MFEEGTELILATGENIPIHDVVTNLWIKCTNGKFARVKSVRKDIQTTYNLSQITKHRPENSENIREFPRLELNCTLGHSLPLAIMVQPRLEKYSKMKKYAVRYQTLTETITYDGRCITVPKFQNKYFPMTVEGKNLANSFLKLSKSQLPQYLNFDIELRDLDYLQTCIRSDCLLKCHPVIEGNGVLSKYLTGQTELVTPSTIAMAWMLGLWIGDGTTKQPEISVDIKDVALLDNLLKIGEKWGLQPSYKDGRIPLRAKHVKLFYGNPIVGKRYRHLTTSNPFWKTVSGLGFKSRDDGSKQVPEFLWHDDVEIREAFLAGLIDADGYVKPGTSSDNRFAVAIQTIYVSVMKGIVNIARSLGIKVSVTAKPARKNVILGRLVSCEHTYECQLVGGSPLQNVLSYCKSGHKHKTKPLEVSRDPIYFRFRESKRGPNWAYTIGIERETNHNEPLLLGNKMAANTCGDNCLKEQIKCCPVKTHKKCIACSRVGSRHFYSDRTGAGQTCGKCHARYVCSGYQCYTCHYIPDRRSLKIAKQHKSYKQLANKEIIPCNRCQMGNLIHDSVRNSKKTSLVDLGSRRSLFLTS
ncbi:Hop KNAG_0E02830 [Huiozyma naganishii CBS 8797]|uniref:DOD-type homing endonuclease domain-containing protein n=1 Tax=Huiozyma naganishii (strain ATCC MYA-139 / BCRC 22969 / CBS 8797 / KCTC 17520 / NBRC 10181 / NCYC 3082 / Yp74L-3) TaxID=1071383 RepID=J7RZB8_HUIN7|nr:hypothetical protein KNAG_0E02830 [Kazachstania naganishii CBS 8797]CCK70542.1 hypothetical protein KNAG_0E02830 [Kazachstania naganishii CBS 8797]